MGSDSPIKPKKLGESVVSGVAPATRWAGEALGDFFNPGYTSTTQNDLFNKVGANDRKAPMQQPKDLDSKARLDAFKSAKDDLRRRRGMQTGFTSGSGLLDSPTTAATTLLGS